MKKRIIFSTDFTSCTLSAVKVQVLKDRINLLTVFSRGFSCTAVSAVNKNDIIKKGLDLQNEQNDLTEDIKKANKHFEALRKLEKNQKITPQEKQDISDIKQEYDTFFDSDSESEINGKTPSWEKGKVAEVLEYLKGEKSTNVLMYEKLAKKNPDIFNILTNKITNRLNVNIYPDVLKSYNENQNNTNLDTDLPNTSSKLNPDTFKGKEISDFEANKDNTDLNKDKGKARADSNPEENNAKKGSVSEYIDSLPIDHNPFDDIGGGD